MWRVNTRRFPPERLRRDRSICRSHDCDNEKKVDNVTDAVLSAATMSDPYVLAPTTVYHLTRH